MDGKQEIQKAYEAILNGDFEKAIEWFACAIEKEPENPDYHYKISITYARSDKLDKALYHAAVAYHMFPQHLEYRYHFQRLRARELAARAQQLLENGGEQVYLALTLLQDAVQLDPLCEEALILKAAAHAELEEYDRAVRMVKKAVDLNPQNEIAVKLLETYKIKLKQFFLD